MTAQESRWQGHGRPLRIGPTWSAGASCLGRAGACLLALLPLAAAAQQSTSGSAQVMWGATPPGLGTAGAEAASGHVANGLSAGQVQAARDGWLLGPNITVNAIGSQNIINVQGSNNNIVADQTATNTGTITNGGRVTARP